MKKITLALVTLALSASSAFSQITVTVQAPPSSNASTQNRAPNGNVLHKSLRGCFIVPQADCQGFALTNNTATHWGFKFLQGTAAVPVTGNFTLYIQSTADVAYNKGTNWATAIAGMPVAYQGQITIPTANAGATVMVQLPAPYVYPGTGGIYVAYEWDSNGPFDASVATYEANHLMNIGGATADASVAPMPTTLSNTNFRPVFLWSCQNTATNEMSIQRLNAPGTVAKLLNAPHTITVQVYNGSNQTLTNKPVGLLVTGANNFTDAQSVTLPAGTSSVVTFTPFNPQTNGINTISVSVLPDQVMTNNAMTWTQSVTCDIQAQNPPVGTYTSGVGFTGAAATGCIVNRIQVPVGAALGGVRLAISNDVGNVGKNVCGVILDNTGALLAYSTNTLTIANANFGTFYTFNFSPSVALTPATNYHVGMAQLSPAATPIAMVNETRFLISGYFTTPIAGGALTPINNFNSYFGIEPIFTFTNLIVSVNANKTTVCKNDGPGTVILTASGVTGTYTWTGGANGNSITVTPTVSGTNGTVVYTVSAIDGASGCPSNIGSKVITVNACAGLSSLNSNGYDIKVYPNPAISGKSTISGLFGANTITVYNTLGQVVSTQVVSEETTTIDLSNQPSGNYLVKITGENHESRSVRIVNQN